MGRMDVKSKLLKAIILILSILYFNVHLHLIYPSLLRISAGRFYATHHSILHRQNQANHSVRQQLISFPC